MYLEVEGQEGRGSDGCCPLSTGRLSEAAGRDGRGRVLSRGRLQDERGRKGREGEPDGHLGEGRETDLQGEKWLGERKEGACVTVLSDGTEFLARVHPKLAYLRTRPGTDSADAQHLVPALLHLQYSCVVSELKATCEPRAELLIFFRHFCVWRARACAPLTAKVDSSRNVLQKNDPEKTSSVFSSSQDSESKLSTLVWVS